MSTVATAAPALSARQKAQRLLAEIKAAGIDLVAALPDAWLSELIDALDADPAITLVRVTREDEAVSLCAGAFLGGRKAAALMQNAGVLLSTNVLAGLALHHQIPVLMLVAQRGGLDDDQYYQVYKGRTTRPVLDAVGIPCFAVQGAADHAAVGHGLRHAHLARMPVALLLERSALLSDPEPAATPSPP